MYPSFNRLDSIISSRGGDDDGLSVTISSCNDSAEESAMLSSSACDRSRPMPSIERKEGRRMLLDGRREGGLSAMRLAVLLDPRDAAVGVAFSASDPDSSASSSVSRADMERDSSNPRPPSAARMAGRPSIAPSRLDVELSRERGWFVDGRREMVTFKLLDGRRESERGGSAAEARRDEARDKEGRAGVGGPSWP